MASSKKHVSRQFIPWVLLLGIGAAFALSCQIQARTPPQQTPHRSAGAALLGESRLGVSSYFYSMADLYFHCGVAHRHEEAVHDTWFQKRLDRLKPHLHMHAEGAASREILPWLDLATRMNPHNVEFILLAAFWLHHEAGERELAQNLLKQAQTANPFEYEIQLERGRLYLYARDIPAARNCFDAALAFWPSQLPASDEGARKDLSRILLYRGLIHEADGENDRAIDCMEAILDMFPARTHLRDRIEALRTGEGPSLLGAAVWNNLLQSEDEHSMLCTTHETAEHVHGDSHHH